MFIEYALTFVANS